MIYEQKDRTKILFGPVFLFMYLELLDGIQLIHLSFIYRVLGMGRLGFSMRKNIYEKKPWK